MRKVIDHQEDVKENLPEGLASLSERQVLVIGYIASTVVGLLEPRLSALEAEVALLNREISYLRRAIG